MIHPGSRVYKGGTSLPQKLYPSSNQTTLPSHIWFLLQEHWPLLRVQEEESGCSLSRCPLRNIIRGTLPLDPLHLEIRRLSLDIGPLDQNARRRISNPAKTADRALNLRLPTKMVHRCSYRLV